MSLDPPPRPTLLERGLIACSAGVVISGFSANRWQPLPIHADGSLCQHGGQTKTIGPGWPQPRKDGAQ